MDLVEVSISAAIPVFLSHLDDPGSAHTYAQNYLGLLDLHNAVSPKEAVVHLHSR